MFTWNFLFVWQEEYISNLFTSLRWALFFHFFFLHISASDALIGFEFGLSGQKVEEDNAFMVVEIGSRPPKCDLKCNSCGHCEAIQVPSNPAQNGRANSSTVAYNVANARGDDTTNYKPMSWKCKCGKYIFDPWSLSSNFN